MSKNILVADDSAAVVKSIDRVLRFNGHTVKTAFNGKEALLALKKEKFDMAIIDSMMPVMDGCELLSRIRKANRQKDIPAVILIEAEGEKMRTRAMALGANGLIAKPFQYMEFINKVEGLLGEKHAWKIRKRWKTRKKNSFRPPQRRHRKNDRMP